MTTLTIKQETIYVAYAADFGMSAYGSCRNEALNNLTEELQQKSEVGELTAYERN